DVIAVGVRIGRDGAARHVGVDRDAGTRALDARDGLAIQVDDAAHHLDRVAGQADDALDIVGAPARRGNDDDVAALGHPSPDPAVPVREDVEAGADPGPAIG